jgi:TrmH family RNA methyltransferase
MPTRARLRLLRSLARADARRAEGLYLVEGRRLVLEALLSRVPLAGVFVTAAFASGAHGPDLLEAAETAGVSVESVPEKDLAALADTKTPQGVVAVVRHVPSDLSILDRPGPGLFLALDAVADPGNVGTLVRAADAFAVRAVIAGPGTADFTNPKVLRGAMGSTFHLACVSVPDLPAALRRLRGSGAFVAAATLDGADTRELPPLPPRVSLVLGNEAHGVSAAARAEAETAVTVACPGRAESLNVALAGGILLALLSGAAR